MFQKRVSSVVTEQAYVRHWFRSMGLDEVIDKSQTEIAAAVDLSTPEALIQFSRANHSATGLLIAWGLA